MAGHSPQFCTLTPTGETSMIMCWTTDEALSDTGTCPNGLCKCLTRALLLMAYHCPCLSPCRVNKPSPLHVFEGSSKSGAPSPTGPGQSMFSRAGTRRRLILGDGAQHSSVAFASSRQGSAEIQMVSLMNPCQAPLWRTHEKWLPVA